MSDAPAWSERVAAIFPASRRGRALVAGLGFGASGFLLALLIVGGFAGIAAPGAIANAGPMEIAAGLALPIAAGLGAALAGAPLWWLLVEKPSEPTKLRGGIVGTAVGVLAHPLMWIVGGVGLALGDLVGGGAPGVGGNLVAEVVGALGALLFVTVFGLLFTGVITVPVAAATGVALAHVRGMVPETESETSERRPQDL